MKYSEQLRLTADEVERRPWHKKELSPGVTDEEDVDGMRMLGLLGGDDSNAQAAYQQAVRATPCLPCCAVGASYAVLEGGISNECLAWADRRGLGDLVSFNDEAESKEVVVDWLRNAASVAEAEGL